MKRVLSLVLSLLFVLGTFAFGTSAEEKETEKLPFTDVTEGAWYYNAVAYCCANGYMAGVGKTQFAPSGNMTRAMFVTVLAAVSGDDVSDFRDVPVSQFSDVDPSRWYAPALRWALSKGVAAGYGSRFGVNDSVSREQMAVMLCGFYKAQNSVNADNEPAKAVLSSASDIDKYADEQNIASWAREAVCFVSHYDIFGGTQTKNGAPYFSPKNNATRAQCAQVIMKYRNTNFSKDTTPIETLTLGGADISEYRIIYGETYTNKPKKNLAYEIAVTLSDKIDTATGVSLEVLKDTETPRGEHEILIGKTNREDDGTVEVNRDKLKPDTAYISMQGTYLVLASNEEKKATYYALYTFLEQCLDYYCYGSGIEMIAPQKEVTVEDGLEIIDEPYMELRTSLQYDTGDMEMREGSSVEFGNMVHTLTAMSKSDFEPTDEFHLKYYLSDDPCLSDPEVIDNIIASAKKVLAKRPDCNRIWVCQSDAEPYCRCENCLKIYRTYGKAATYVQIMQYVGNALKEDYPDVKIVGIAYKFTHTSFKTDVSEAEYAAFLENYGARKYVPERSLECPDNVVCCLATDTACSSHPIGDINCRDSANNSVTLANQIDILRKIYKHMYVWYYVDGDDMNYPCPNFDIIYENYAYFVRNGFEGMYIQGTTRNYADFAILRTYVTGRLSWYSQMTKDEYNSMIDSYLKACYGNGWTYIREYIDTLTSLMQENEWHVWTKASWNDRISEDQYAENIDYLLSLWDKALSLCDNAAQRTRVLETQTEIKNVANKIGA